MLEPAFVFLAALAAGSVILAMASGVCSDKGGRGERRRLVRSEGFGLLILRFDRGYVRVDVIEPHVITFVIRRALPLLLESLFDLAHLRLEFSKLFLVAVDLGVSGVCIVASLGCLESFGLLLLFDALLGRIVCLPLSDPSRQIWNGRQLVAELLDPVRFLIRRTFV